MAPEIIAELGDHGQYFEPFCGSMAVLMAKEPSQKETVCDLHADLTNLARVIQDRDTAEKLYDRTQRVLFCDEILKDAKSYLEITAELEDGEIDAERAYWYFLASWMGRNGTAGTARIDYQLAVAVSFLVHVAAVVPLTLAGAVILFLDRGLLGDLRALASQVTSIGSSSQAPPANDHADDRQA